MGLDGGTYITRSDVLRGQCWDLNKADNSRSTRGGSVHGTHKRAKLDPKVERKTKWSTCSLSEERLKAPIVADFLGNLYNKVAVLEFLLGRSGKFADKPAEHRYFNQMSASGAAFDHLRTTRDIFEVKLDANRRDADPQGRESYCCPVTDMPCESYPFSAISTCGHIFSDRAIQQASFPNWVASIIAAVLATKVPSFPEAQCQTQMLTAGKASATPPELGLAPYSEVEKEMCLFEGGSLRAWATASRDVCAQMAAGTCSLCNREFVEEAVVPINGSPEQVQQLRERRAARGALKRSRKAPNLGCRARSPPKLCGAEPAESSSPKRLRAAPA